VGVVSLEEAKEAAASAGLDLVEIVPNAEPPVCRIMDYGKFVFEQKKQKQAAKKKQKQVQVKEVKFRPHTDIGDYQIKLRNLPPRAGPGGAAARGEGSRGHCAGGTAPGDGRSPDGHGAGTA